MEFLERLHRHSAELQDIDVIVCSPALRCSQTCNLLCSVIDIEPERVIYDNRIYAHEQGYETLRECIVPYLSHKEHICIIGHNNSISSLASILTQQTTHMKRGKIIHTSIYSS